MTHPMPGRASPASAAWRALRASFQVGGVNEWVFLEDARSFAAKLALMREKRLRGFSAWVLGREDEEIWTVLAREPRPRAALPPSRPGGASPAP